MINSKEISSVLFSEAISNATIRAMRENKKVILLGIGLQYPSGIFGTTNKVFAEFGPSRVFDTPAMENALTGIAVGMSNHGLRPCLIHARADFMVLSFDQLINSVAKWKYMFGGRGGSVPISIRAIVGRGWGQGATHSQSFHSPLSNIPGLRILLPFSIQDAYDMTLASLIDDVPTVIFEHRLLYSMVGESYETNLSDIDVSSARLERSGTDVTLAGYSYAVYELMKAAEILEADGISCEVINLRSNRGHLSETYLNSCKKTGRVYLHDIGWPQFGSLAEVIVSTIENIDSKRIIKFCRKGLATTPAPASEYLERHYYPSVEIIASEISNFLGVSVREKEAFSRTEETRFEGPY